MNFIDQNVKFDRIKRLDLAANKRTYTVTVNSKAQFCNITGYKPCHRAVVDDVKRNFITGLFYTLFVSGFVVGLIVGVFAGSTAADQMFYSSLAGAIAGAIAAPIQSAIIHIDDEEDPVFDIDSVRLFAMRLLAIILGSALIGASGNASAGAAMVAIGVAFVGSLVAGVLSRKPIKSITNAIIFSVSFGALVGTAIRTVGGTIPGAISGAITAGVVAMTFDTLKTIFRTVIATGTFSEMVKIVAGVIKTIPREDKRAVIIGTVIGAILNTFVGKGALFGAVAGALYATRYVTLPNITDLIKIFYSIMLSLFALCIEVTYVALGVGAAGTVGGLIVIVLISTSLIIHPPGNPIFDPFRYKPVFAAVAGICAGVATVILIFTDRVDFPQPLGRSVTAAVIGAAAVGFLLAAVVNGIRRVDRAITTFNDRSIAAIRIDVARGILRRIDIAIIQAAIGAVCGTMFGYVLELIAGDKLAGDKLAEITMGAILGTITGIASGSITAIAVATIKNVTVPAITKMCTVQRIIVVTTIGAFIGGIFGGYFVSNIVAGFLIALSFSVVTTVIYTAHLYEERRRWFKRVNQIPLVSVMNTFGIELRYLTNEEAQNNWLLYKIAKAP